MTCQINHSNRGREAQSQASLAWYLTKDGWWKSQQRPPPALLQPDVLQGATGDSEEAENRVHCPPVCPHLCFSCQASARPGGHPALLAVPPWTAGGANSKLPPPPPQDPTFVLPLIELATVGLLTGIHLWALAIQPASQMRHFHLQKWAVVPNFQQFFLLFL